MRIITQLLLHQFFFSNLAIIIREACTVGIYLNIHIYYKRRDDWTNRVDDILYTENCSSHSNSYTFTIRVYGLKKKIILKLAFREWNFKGKKKNDLSMSACVREIVETRKQKLKRKNVVSIGGKRVQEWIMIDVSKFTKTFFYIFYSRGVFAPRANSRDRVILTTYIYINSYTETNLKPIRAVFKVFLLIFPRTAQHFHISHRSKREIYKFLFENI